MIVTDALAEELYSFPAPLDPRVRAFVRTQDAPGQTAYDLALSQRIDRILAMTRMQRDQYRIRDCCVVVLDGDGALVSMNVCRDREDPESGKINSCLVPRQTGSAIKPFLYLYAFKQLRLSSTDMIIDEPVQFDLGG